MAVKIGITERGDPVFDLSWKDWIQRGNPAILISKDPLSLWRHLQEFKDPNIIVHTTITGYGSTILEPYVPVFSNALEGFGKLCRSLGPERVVLRVDPVFPTSVGLSKAQWVIVQAQKLYKTRVRISFLDLYPHVRARFENHGINIPWNTFHAPLDFREAAWVQLGQPEICGEPGFKCAGCVSELDCNILGVKVLNRCSFQRTICNCSGNKHELLKNKQRCGFKCIYCYWREPYEK